MIIDRQVVGKRDVLKVAEDAMRSGADIIQLRDKISCDAEVIRTASEISRLAAKYKKPFIVNDRPDIAVASGADGVHLGQADMPVSEARKIMGAGIIGVSTHSVKQAFSAQRNGADYIAIGPVFKTATKRGLRPIGVFALKRLSGRMRIPVFAIGGLSAENIHEIMRAGEKRIAVASAAVTAADVYGAVRRLKKLL